MSISNKDVDNKLRQLINQIKIPTERLEGTVDINYKDLMTLCNHDSGKTDIFFKIKNGISELCSSNYSYLHVDPKNSKFLFRIILNSTDLRTLIRFEIPLIQNKKTIQLKNVRKDFYRDEIKTNSYNKKTDSFLRFLINNIGLDKEEIYNLTEKILFRIY